MYLKFYCLFLHSWKKSRDKGASPISIESDDEMDGVQIAEVDSVASIHDTEEEQTKHIAGQYEREFNLNVS